MKGKARLTIKRSKDGYEATVRDELQYKSVGDFSTRRRALERLERGGLTRRNQRLVDNALGRD